MQLLVLSCVKWQLANSNYSCFLTTWGSTTVELENKLHWGLASCENILQLLLQLKECLRDSLLDSTTTGLMPPPSLCSKQRFSIISSGHETQIWAIWAQIWILLVLVFFLICDAVHFSVTFDYSSYSKKNINVIYFVVTCLIIRETLTLTYILTYLH